jgi:predicted nucleic acid-binding protein
MTTLVVDASVVLKWLGLFHHEPLVAEAQLLLDRWQQGSVGLLAPDLVWAEVVNAHWRGTRQNRFTATDAQASLATLRGHGLPTVHSEPFIERALEIACHYGRTAYDSLYVALAEHSQRTLLTADEKLANALAGSFPVRWLGAI